MHKGAIVLDSWLCTSASQAVYLCKAKSDNMYHCMYNLFHKLFLVSCACVKVSNLTLSLAYILGFSALLSAI